MSERIQDLLAAMEDHYETKLGTSYLVFHRSAGALSRQNIKGSVLLTLGSGRRNREESDLGNPVNELVVIACLSGTGIGAMEQDLAVEDLLSLLIDATEDHGSPPFGVAEVEWAFVESFQKIAPGEIDANIAVRLWTE